ncbi:toluene tolerance family protein [Desulfonema ishimotonii]|uniref:Toluene tolerance family protein n=1 Tax=Desulfonema ishimotonii TaxID=45657 RepID=A0A401G039_9BACT|nr:ABC transporter substrate-binding protein [Desulfonema ishimotonii]GBC62585.1 toluene tolerance family protein [Desulfonema ishimotonii]
MKRTILIFHLLIFGWATVLYSAQVQPLDELKGPIEQGIAILNNPEYTRPDQKEAQREKIWALVQNVFDFRAISMRALARNWRRLNETQRGAFTEAFSVLLKNTYIDKLQGEYHNEKLVFLGQDMIADRKAVVRTKILRKKIEIPMDYSMYLRSGKWRVYDVNIEGVSLVKNYRSQFNSILAKESPDQLIQRLKEKNDAHEQKRKGVK